ncbi:MAG: response regulator transcription factor [Bacteroidales bacterium]|nr:response regulator transcription factor [Bacteroidales bacterium]
MKPKQKIFLVEDDHNFGAVLKSYLEINDYHVKWVLDGKDAFAEFNKDEFDICILDVMLPNVDGFMIASEIKKYDNNVPLIFLTAKTLKEDILKGYGLGADDYITKPFDSEVLLCKISAILNRKISGDNDKEIPDIFEIGKYRFNWKLRQIQLNDNIQKLSPKESELLKLLCINKNEVLPRRIALKNIWRDDNYFTTRSMDVYITKLRKYLKEDTLIEIANIHSSGYRLIIREK